jgi:hypothetical protein
LNVKAYPFSNGYIYIGELKCINTIASNDNKILIQDARSKNNPDMKVFESYKINDEKIQKEIINKMLYHEKNHPSKWDRTETSMINEWYAHNLLYNMNLKKDRTRDVDFDNNDEETFKEKLGLNTLIKYFSK